MLNNKYIIIFYLNKIYRFEIHLSDILGHIIFLFTPTSISQDRPGHYDIWGCARTVKSSNITCTSIRR